MLEWYDRFVNPKRVKLPHLNPSSKSALNFKIAWDETCVQTNATSQMQNKKKKITKLFVRPNSFLPARIFTIATKNIQKLTYELPQPMWLTVCYWVAVVFTALLVPTVEPCEIDRDQVHSQRKQKETKNLHCNLFFTPTQSPFFCLFIQLYIFLQFFSFINFCIFYSFFKNDKFN